MVIILVNKILTLQRWVLIRGCINKTFQLYLLNFPFAYLTSAGIPANYKIS